MLEVGKDDRKECMTRRVGAGSAKGARVAQSARVRWQISSKLSHDGVFFSSGEGRRRAEIGVD